jgi:hypothetical protein
VAEQAEKPAIVVICVMSGGVDAVIIVEIVVGGVDAVVVIGVMVGAIIGATAIAAAATAAASTTTASATPAAAAILGEHGARQRCQCRDAGEQRKGAAAMDQVVVRHGALLSMFRAANARAAEKFIRLRRENRRPRPLVKKPERTATRFRFASSGFGP